jgi:hypothetical protein
VHTDGDPISCGWKRAIADVQRALDDRGRVCGVGGPREAASDCIGLPDHAGEHEDVEGGTWPVAEAPRYPGSFVRRYYYPPTPPPAAAPQPVDDDQKFVALLAEVRKAAVYMLERRTYWATRSTDTAAIPRAIAYQHMAGHLIRIIDAHRTSTTPAVPRPDDVTDADWERVAIQLDAYRHCLTEKGRQTTAARLRRLIGGIIRHA